MNNPTELTADLHHKLDAALGQQGLLQEILLLRLLNAITARFATGAAQWQAAQSLEYKHWRQEITLLLDTLQFMIHSADAYAPDSSGLERDIAQLGEQLGAIEQRLRDLNARKTALQDQLDQQDADRAALHEEIEWLERLQQLAPFRAALAQHLDIQRLRASANAELLREQDRQRQRGDALINSIDSQLSELDALLRENLILTEQEWEVVRRAVDASATR